MKQDYSVNDLQILFKLVSKGDTAAFKELFEAYRGRLCAAAYQVAKSTDAAEDIVQEIFTRIWENRLHLCEIDNPSAYVFTIGYHESFRYLKKVSQDQKLFEALKSRIKIMDNHTEEWMEVTETQRIIDQVIEALPPQRQLIYKLSREGGLSYKEIAGRLHISSLTVKKQLQLALRNIRAGLSKIRPLLFLLFLIR